eukprot:scaffold34966_cov99-Isochrysis_galbana.AAC.1
MPSSDAATISATVSVFTLHVGSICRQTGKVATRVKNSSVGAVEKPVAVARMADTTMTRMRAIGRSVDEVAYEFLRGHPRLNWRRPSAKRRGEADGAPSNCTMSKLRQREQRFSLLLLGPFSDLQTR